MDKAESRLSALTNIMPSVRGRSRRSREILYGVVQFQVLYTTLAWETALDLKKNRIALEELHQRRTLLRIDNGYRTILFSPGHLGNAPNYFISAEATEAFPDY